MNQPRIKISKTNIEKLEHLEHNQGCFVVYTRNRCRYVGVTTELKKVLSIYFGIESGFRAPFAYKIKKGKYLKVFVYYVRENGMKQLRDNLILEFNPLFNRRYEDDMIECVYSPLFDTKGMGNTKIISEAKPILMM